MGEAIQEPNHSSRESYHPKKPEILNMAEHALMHAQEESLPSECILKPKDRIAPFSGAKWPYSNVEPAVYGMLGLFYGRTERRDATDALINDDMEYAVHNVLTGHAFGLFNCLPDDSLSMAAYGLSSSHLDPRDHAQDEILAIIREQIYQGNAVHVDEGNGAYDYLIWGYRDSGNVLLGYRFEHGDDMQNCACDFDHPTEFTTLIQSFADNTLYQNNGEKPGGITFYRPDGERVDREILYRRALLQGYRMLTQVEPPPAMDFTRVHFGYGQAIYDAWVHQLEQANAENSETFYFASPVFPHFLALHENRLQLHKFLKIYAEMRGDENLSAAAGLCGQLKDLAVEAAQIGYENEHSKPEILAMTHNERRVLLIGLLKRCRALELEIAEHLRIFADLPEGYSPKRPEILTAAKAAVDTAVQKAEEPDTARVAAPRMVQKAFRLVGMKGNVGSVWPNFGPLLEDLYQTVRDRLGQIEGLAEPVRMVGFWHMDASPSGEHDYCYFAGVEASCENPPEGLVIKTLPESFYAVFTEQRRGTIGSPNGYAYKQWLPASKYAGNAGIPGDFEVFGNMADTGPQCEAEIWIPVTSKQPPEGHGPKKPEI